MDLSTPAVLAKNSLQQCRIDFRSNSNYSILSLAMRKRKPAGFSVAKAVKANARERVGQPKPARIVEDRPRTGRKAKHRTKLDQLIVGEE
jgi:hypothetical protein